MQVRVQVAGQDKYESFAPAPNFAHQYVWNGRDALGQLVNGQQSARVSIGFHYNLVYLSVLPSGSSGNQMSFAQFGSGTSVNAAIYRDWYEVWKTLPTKRLGSYWAKGLGLGGWSLDVHHAYDNSSTLWRGDGRRERPRVAQQARMISQFDDSNVDNSAQNYYMTVGSDGLVYLTEGPGRPGRILPRIWKIDWNGAATLFPLNFLWPMERIGPIVASPDGTLYFDSRAALPDGVSSIVCVQRNGLLCGRYYMIGKYTYGRILDLAMGPDGSLYFAAAEHGDGTGHRAVGKFDPVDGLGRIITSLYGPDWEAGDGGPAQFASFRTGGGATWDQQPEPMSLAVGQDGSIYVANHGECTVRRIGVDGIINTVAGACCNCGQETDWDAVGNSVDSAQSRLAGAAVIRMGRDGSLYVADGGGWWDSSGMPVILKLKDGRVTRIAGKRSYGGQGRDGPALQSEFDTINGLGVSPNGDLFFLMGDRYLPGAQRGVGVLEAPLPGIAWSTSSLVASQDGRELYDLDYRGRHVRTVDPLTGATRLTFGYAPGGLLTSVTDSNGLVTSITRDDNGEATGIVAPNGQVTALTIDPNGYLSAIDTVGDRHHAFTYYSGEAEGLLKTYTNPRGLTSTISYDELGRVVSEDMPGECSWQLSRTGPSPTNPRKSVRVNLMSATGMTRAYQHGTDEAGTKARTLTSSAGLKSTVVKTQAASTSRTSPDGTVMTTVEGPDPRFGMQAPIVTQTTTRTPQGLQMEVARSRSATTDGTPESTLVTQIDTTTINGKTSTSTYDAASQTVTAVSPEGRQTVTTLDNHGRVVGVQSGNLAPTAYEYDARGRLENVTVGTGVSARATTFGYDELDRLTSVTDPLTRVQQYIYDDANRVVGQIFPDTSQVAFSYDANGNVTSVTPPSRPAHAFGFTPNDLMSSYTPPAVSGAGATTYEHNLDKQPTAIHRPDGSQTVFTYDSAGRLSTTTYPKGPEASDGTITITRTYNPTTGKLASVSTSDGQAVSYGYDGRLLTSTTWTGTVAGTVSRTYNSDFQVTSESVNGGNTVAFGYDNDGLPTTAGGLAITRDPISGLITDTTMGQVTDHRTHDSFGMPATYEAKFGGASLYSVVYTRDSLGRIEMKTETIQGTTTVWNYNYDSAGRLWQVMKDAVLAATYLYDSNGNRLSKTTPAGTETATYDAQDRLLTYSKWAYAYTANGELRTKTDTTTGEVTRYSYDGAGSLRNVELPNGTIIDYIVDAAGRRIGKKVNGSLVKSWLYRDALYPAAEVDASGMARWTGQEYLSKSGTTRRVIRDERGSPRLLVDVATGALAGRQDFDEWGASTGASPASPLGFAAGILDEDTGLVRFGARDYDPTTGRWTAKDPISFGSGTLGLYTYAANDPVNRVDISGLDYIVYNPTSCAESGATSGELAWYDDDGNKKTSWDAASGGSDNSQSITSGNYTTSYACRVERKKDEQEAWGPVSFPLTPDAATRQRIKDEGRSGGYYVHGGHRVGTHGCIEIADYTFEQKELLRLRDMLRSYGKPISVRVEGSQ